MKKDIDQLLDYEDIVETIHEPLLVLNSDLKVLSANRSFYETFKVIPENTIGSLIYDLGNRQWDIPDLRTLFEGIIHKDKPFNDYEVIHAFPAIGRRIMLLNARRILRKGTSSNLILLAIEDITDRRLAEEKVRNMAITDALTGIYNRRGFIALAEQQIKTASRNKEQMRLFYIDVDSMKEINDKLGHVAGDQSLIETANVLRRTFRKSDIIARIGGDEFVILAIDVKGIDSQVFSERLRNNIDELNRKESRSYKLGLSWGAAAYDPETPTSLHQLMSEADQIMYTRKNDKLNS